VPAEFYSDQEPEAPQPIVIQVDTGSFSQPAQAAPVRTISRLSCLIFSIVGVVILFGLVMIMVPVLGIFTANKAIQEVVDIQPTEIDVKQIIATMQLISDEPTDIPTETPVSLGNLGLKFGALGSGPGYFDDPRQVTTDPDGNIYVADFQTGRVQKFDPTGKFLLAIQVIPDKNENTIISDLATDYRGHLYVVRMGDILVYDAKNGALISTIPQDFPDTYYQAVKFDPANNLFALAQTPNSHDLIRLTDDGKEISRSEAVVSSIDRQVFLEDWALAVDGLGNAYFVTDNKPQVFIYNNAGEYIDKFGSQGEEPGQLYSPDSVAVDANGRIYVLDYESIDIFDESGGFLGAIVVDYSLGSPREIWVDLQGNLYLVTSEGLVMKYSLNW
jgi:DNA-binding beta-propeller fold protein YncE